MHNGLDIAVPQGTPVKAAQAGKITAAGTSDSYGNYIKLQTDVGTTVLYAHLSKHIAKEGDVVKQGDVVALSGMTGWATGPHLHFTTEKDGVAFDPLTLYN